MGGGIPITLAKKGKSDIFSFEDRKAQIFEKIDENFGPNMQYKRVRRNVLK